MANERIILIFGDYFYRKKKRDEFLSGIAGKYSLSMIEDPSEESFFKSLLTLSLFDETKVVITESFSLTKKMIDIVKRISLSPNYLIIEGEDKADGDSLYKKISEVCPALIYSLEKPKKKKDVEKFIIAQAEEMSMNMGREAASLLAEYCNDYSVANEELKKLKILFSDAEITSRDIRSSVLPTIEKKSSLDFYVSLMTGNLSESISNSREIIEESGHEEVFSCIMKIMELCLLFSLLNGNKYEVSNYRGKKPKPISGRLLKMGLIGVSDWQKPPSDFLLRVAQKVYERMNSKKRASDLFIRAYNHMKDFRLESNKALASSHVDELVCALSRI